MNPERAGAADLGVELPEAHRHGIVIGGRIKVAASRNYRSRTVIERPKMKSPVTRHARYSARVGSKDGRRTQDGVGGIPRDVQCHRRIAVVIEIKVSEQIQSMDPLDTQGTCEQD